MGTPRVAAVREFSAFGRGSKISRTWATIPFGDQSDPVGRKHFQGRGPLWGQRARAPRDEGDFSASPRCSARRWSVAGLSGCTVRVRLSCRVGVSQPVKDYASSRST